MERTGLRKLPGYAQADWLVPSPLLAQDVPFVLLYFRFEPDGRLTLPHLPDKSLYHLAVPQYLSEQAVQDTRKYLARVAALLDRGRPLGLLPAGAPPVRKLVAAPSVAGAEQRLAQQRQAGLLGRGRGAFEFDQRSQAIANTGLVARSQLANMEFGPWPPPTDLDGAQMKPLWVGGELFLARRAIMDGQESVQGCLLDWPGIRRWPLESISDLLPEADLEPILPGSHEPESRRLAALPIRLVPGSLPAEGVQTASAVRLSLLVAWGCLGTAAAAVGALLAGVIRLSERRAAFVSAVTHELKTPLTTFHMYTEMLGAGMVCDPDQQREYLRTLRAEASRLSHLVENVLAYARLQRGRIDGRVEPIRVGRLLEGCRGRLFRPFSKSAQEAADSTPGIGLGLALSRRLAQDMGAQLRLDDTLPDGACFELIVPVAR